MRGPSRVVVFGFDAAESAQVRRIRALRDCGYALTVYAPHRTGTGAAVRPPWPSVSLGRVENGRLGRRLLALARGLLAIARHLGPIRRADVLIARNFDLLLLAEAARLLALRPRLPLVYECLDIHALFSARTLRGALMRAAERLLLARIRLLVISSPGFEEHYFRPLQRYRGPVHLLENKIWFGGTPPPRREGAHNCAGGRPWVIGWAGSLRCTPSLDLLLALAERLGDRVRLEFFGNVHHHALPGFARRLEGHPNVAYRGPYAYPQGLGAVYGACDFVWAQDLWQMGENSHWLLPNRIYEASYFGCLSIALAGTMTGCAVRAGGLGYVIERADGESLARLFQRLDPAEVVARREALLTRPAAAFVASRHEVAAMVERARAPSPAAVLRSGYAPPRRG